MRRGVQIQRGRYGKGEEIVCMRRVCSAAREPKACLCERLSARPRARAGSRAARGRLARRALVRQAGDGALQQKHREAEDEESVQPEGRKPRGTWRRAVVRTRNGQGCQKFERRGVRGECVEPESWSGSGVGQQRDHETRLGASGRRDSGEVVERREREKSSLRKRAASRTPGSAEVRAPERGCAAARSRSSANEERG